LNEYFDVVVCGGGTSGIPAAISAARNGMKVALIEKNPGLGGSNTNAMVSPLMTFHAGEKQVIKGIAQEIVDRLLERNATLGHVRDTIGMVSTITPIDTEALKLLYFEMLSAEPNISVLLGSPVTKVSVKQNTIQMVTVSGRYGKTVISGKTFIDATGDGDIINLSKENYVMGRTKDGMSQPMSLMFKVSGVDLQKVRDYISNNPEQFIWNSQCSVDEYLGVSGFFSHVKRAQENGDLTIPRDRVLFFQGLVDGEVTVNMTRVIKLSAVDAYDLTKAEFEGHAQVDETVCFLRKYIPGFENCRLQSVANSIGVRESRRLSGAYTLTANDVINNQQFDDSVAVCAFPIDIHSPDGSALDWERNERFGCFDIPYRTMLPKKVNNLIVAGRCISATHEALAAARISATAMALGEAAGLACAMSVKGNVDVGSINVEKLQENLLKQSAIPGKKYV
jgi:ribulose 1,5-bisphosphate synthetase/thiazole synthase